METKEDVLKDKYIMSTSNGKQIVFNNKTPRKVAEKLVYLYEIQKRVIFDYGDIKTGISWNEEFDISGYIGLSKGIYSLYYPILVHNKRSLGGGLILTHCILSIKESKGKKLIYSNTI